MEIFILLAVLSLGYILIKRNDVISDPPPGPTSTELMVINPAPGYNPFILNQFQEMKDAIFSADIRENRIESKPSMNATGIYGITETQLKLHPYDATTITYTPKHLLNV